LIVLLAGEGSVCFIFVIIWWKKNV